MLPLNACKTAFSHDDIDLDDIDYDIVTFFSDRDKFDEDDHSNTVPFRLLDSIVIDFINVKPAKKDRQRNNAYNMTSNKGAGLLYDKRWKVVK